MIAARLQGDEKSRKRQSPKQCRALKLPPSKQLLRYHGSNNMWIDFVPDKSILLSVSTTKMSTTNLTFIRSQSCMDCWDYYEIKTDVLVFGDVEGYEYFRQQLSRAQAAKENVHLTWLEQHPTSMRSVILPACDDGAAEARLKFIERFVSGNSGPNMELVIFGNKTGFRYLAYKLEKMEKEFVGQPSEHIHLDDITDPHVVPRSVSLNLRGPLRKWERDNFDEYSDLILKRGEHFTPAAVRYRVGKREEYEEITATESEFLSLRPGCPAQTV